MITGFILLKLPPKQINDLYGYRTSASMLSPERWTFSQKYAAKELIRFGTVLAFASILGLCYSPTKNIGVILGLA